MRDKRFFAGRRHIAKTPLAIVLGFAMLAALGAKLPAARVTGEAASSILEVIPIDSFPELRFEQPTVITNAGDGRIFIAEQPGRIWIVKGSGPAAVKIPFLDITARVQDGCEMGLLGLAFHPNYQQNGYFYVNYIASIEGRYETRVSRFRVTADPDRADEDSELILLEIPQPYCNHNGGDLHFDPQGMLVTSLGDGGSGGDPHNNSQDVKSLLGKLVRIDVDRRDPGKNYAIPADNPFIGEEPLDEIWALGLRNPWRFSFDSGTGDLYIGDVGQDTWEEIDYVPAADAGGQNFGWRLKEGFACFNPQQGCDPGGLTDPVFVYEQEDGSGLCSITGGAVYRGQEMAALNGTYIYADFCTGRLFGLVSEGSDTWRSWQLAQAEPSVVALGTDNRGELYLAARDKGRIYQLAESPRQLLPLIQRR